MTPDEKTVRQQYEDLEKQQQQRPKLNVWFRKVSPRHNKKAWKWIGIVVIVAIAALIQFCGKSEPRKNADTHAESNSVLIPDTEITESYLSSLVDAKDIAGPKTTKKSPEKAKVVKPPLVPVGPMTIYLSDEATGAVGSLGIPMGTEIEAVIEMKVIASDRSVPVIARVTQPLIRDGNLILPKDARLFGQTSGAVEDRLNVKFRRIVFPNGEEYSFSGVALDRNGAGGIQGKVDRKKGSRALAILGSAALGATSVFMPGGSSYGDSFARNAQREALGDAGRDVNYYRRTGASPAITIRANTRITVLVDRSS